MKSANPRGPFLRPLVGLLGLTVLAACLQPTDSTPATPGLDPTVCRIDCGPGLWDNSTMSECTGYQNNFMQPKSSVFHAELPPPLKPDGGVFYSAGLDIWACKQALIDNEAVDNVDLAFFYTLISNPDSKTRTDSYILLLTVYSNSSVFVEAAQRHGLNVTLAPHFGDESRTPTAENVDYTTFAYPSDSKDFIFRGAVDHTAASDWSATLAVYYVSAGKIRRILWSEEGKIDTANEGMMEFGPGSYWAKHSRANHIDDSVNYQTRTAITFGFDNRWTMNSTASD